MVALSQHLMALTIAGGTAKDLVTQAIAGEQLGYKELWLADTGYPDPLSSAASLLHQTVNARVGVAVVPVYTRSPAVLASSAATLDELSGGRFILGLGTSSHAMMENWHGTPLVEPLERMRETVTLIRTMLKGEKTNFQGRILQSKGFRIPLAAEVPIYMAALRPRMLELAGEIADGVVLNLFPYHALPKIIEHIAIGAKRGGRELKDIPIVSRYQVAVCEDLDAHRELFRLSYSGYFSTPVYNHYLAWCGYQSVADELKIGWQQKDRSKTAAAFSDELIDSIAIIGDLAHCQKRIRWCAKHGVQTHMITCASMDAKIRQQTLEAFAPAVFDPVATK